MAEVGFVPHVMIVESRFYPDVADEMARGAIAQIEAAAGTYKRVFVPTLFEIPVAIRYAIRAVEIFPARKRFDGYLALGCHIKDTGRDDLISAECTHALMALSTQFSLALGYGIAAVETREDAWKCAAAKGGDDLGGKAASACLEMIELKTEFKLFPRSA
jgi:6,7-dimethyl-8-ribityllumazine synthase